MADFIVIDEITNGLVLGAVPRVCPKISAVAGDSKVAIYVTDASDTVIDGQTLVTVAGTKVVYKTSGYPTSPDDGTEVFTSTVGQYQSSGYELSGLDNETTYYFAAFTVSDHGMYCLVSATAKATPTEQEIADITVSYPSVATLASLGSGVASEVTLVDATSGESQSAKIDGAIGNVQFNVAVGNSYYVKSQLQTYTVSVVDGKIVYTYTDVDYSLLNGYGYIATEKSDTYTAEQGNTREIAMDLTRGFYMGYDYDQSEDDPESSITYPKGTLNEGYEPFQMDLSTGTPDFGGWADNELFKRFRPVMLNFDGTVAYELDHNDHTKQIDGSTASDISDLTKNMNAMVEIKKVYCKRSMSGNIQSFRVSDIKLDATYYAYLWIDENGDEKDVVFLPMFEGYVNSSKLRSVSGVKPTSGTTGANEITYAKNLGDGWNICDYAGKTLIEDLLFMIGKSTDVKAHFGHGHLSGGTQASNLLTNGGTTDKGMFYGRTASNNTYVKVFYIENFWGDRWDRTIGCVTDANKHVRVKLFPPYDETGSYDDTYTDCGVVVSGTGGGYISKTTYSDETARNLDTVSGSSQTYIPSGGWFKASCFLLWGGSCDNGALCGVARGLHSAFSDSAWDIGASPSCR